LSQEGANQVPLRILDDLQTKPDAPKGGLEEGSNVCRRINQRRPKRINKVGYSRIRR